MAGIAVRGSGPHRSVMSRQSRRAIRTVQEPNDMSDPISPVFADPIGPDTDADADVEQQAGYRIDASDPTAVTGTSRLANLTQLEAILDWPGLYLLSATCEELIAGNRKKP